MKECAANTRKGQGARRGIFGLMPIYIQEQRSHFFLLESRSKEMEEMEEMEGLVGLLVFCVPYGNTARQNPDK